MSKNHSRTKRLAPPRARSSHALSSVLSSVLSSILLLSFCPLVAARQQTRDAKGPRLVAALRSHTGDIVNLRFSPDGSLLATGAEDGTVRLWDARSGTHKAALRLADKLDRLTISWSPDGSLLVTDWSEGLETNKGRAQVWDARSGELCATIAGHRWDVNSFDWSPDGRRLLTASEDGTARVWDARTGAQLAEIVFEKVNADDYTYSILKDVFTRKKLPEFISLVARYADGGRRILVSSAVRPPRLYTSAGEPLAPLALAPPAPEQSYVFYPQPVLSPDGRLVFTHEGAVSRVWDAATGERRYTLAGAGHLYRFSPDGRTILTTLLGNVSGSPWFAAPPKPPGKAPTLVLWDAGTGDQVRAFHDLPAPYETHWSPDGAKLVLVGTGDTKTRVVDLLMGRSVKLPWGGCGPSDSMFGDGACDPFVFSADGRVTVKLKGELRLFDTDTGELVAALPDTNRRAAFHPTDARLFAARSKDKRSVFLYELPTR